MQSEILGKAECTAAAFYYSPSRSTNYRPLKLCIPRLKTILLETLIHPKLCFPLKLIFNLLHQQHSSASTKRRSLEQNSCLDKTCKTPDPGTLIYSNVWNTVHFIFSIRIDLESRVLSKTWSDIKQECIRYQCLNHYQTHLQFI